MAVEGKNGGDERADHPPRLRRRHVELGGRRQETERERKNGVGTGTEERGTLNHIAKHISAWLTPHFEWQI